MLAKILVGVVAAIAVTGVGIYYAMPDYSQPTCQKHNSTESLPTSEGTSCCAMKTPVCSSESLISTEPSGCCAVKTTCCEAVSNDALAACVGGMPMPTSAPLANTRAKGKGHCCDE